jgi:hypothetical protein
MRFPNPVAVTCLTCGQLTVLAETSTGSLRVHCGTWRWQCDTVTASVTRSDRHAAPPAGLTRLDTAREKKLAA